ncbi:MAG: hypothetical protein QME81_05450 [bacterium]|nr:hypothetical protein [bacterium]
MRNAECEMCIFSIFRGRLRVETRFLEETWFLRQRIADCGMRNADWKIRNPKFEGSLQSVIRNPEFAIRNPESAIRNPQSEIGLLTTT